MKSTLNPGQPYIINLITELVTFTSNTLRAIATVHSYFIHTSFILRLEHETEIQADEITKRKQQLRQMNLKLHLILTLSL